MAAKDKIRKRKAIRKLIITPILIDGLLIAGYAIYAIVANEYLAFRLDQYMSTLCSTLAAVVITMFGLSAASYAFVCSELRAEESKKPYLSKVLKKYFENMWIYFISSLIFSGMALVTCVFCLSFGQYLGSDVLLEVFSETQIRYYNDSFTVLCILTFAVCIISLTAFFVMLAFNYHIFQREAKYDKIAIEMRQEIASRYAQPENEEDQTDIGLEKVNNLEKLINRIIKNHEDVGKSFNSEERNDRMISNLFLRKINDGYLSENNTCSHTWDSIKNTEKRQSRWDCCCEMAKHDKEWLEKEESCDRKTEPALPSDIGFTEVYDDLICYRDTVLVSKNSQKEKDQIRQAVCLRRSIKKRLLIFMMWGESFNGMDLSRMSLSGGDFQNTDFSKCDLTYSRLKGAYCKEADFSNAKMPGLYFIDSGNCDGEIAVTFKDDSKGVWDPYNGKEATYFSGATFANADVSRACLLAEGPLWNDSFPFDSADEPEKEYLFSMENTSFDYAKLYSSRLANINFDKANFQKALIFNSVWFQCSAEKAGFEGVTMTNSVVVSCNFHGSDMNGIVFPGSILYRNNFRGVLLENANFSDSNILRCNFSNSYCHNASFVGVIQDKCKVCDSLKCHQLDSGSIAGSLDDDCNVDFSYATLSKTDFSAADLSRINFSFAVGKDCIFTNANGSGTIFDKALLSSSIFNKTHLENALFSGTVLMDSVFMGCQFSACSMEGTDMSRSIFILGDAPMFSQSELIDVDFSYSRGLTPAFFENITLIRCDFRGSGVTSQDLKKAKIRCQNCIFDGKRS